MADARASSGQRALRPRNAASLVLADLSDSRPLFLMGKRPSAHVFMAGKRVFPGGRVERGDAFGTAPTAVPLPDIERLKTELGKDASERRAIAFGRCAVRETAEETGIDLQALGLATPVRYLARAITPPGMPRRFDTRFFLAVIAPGAKGQRGSAGDGELVDIGWYDTDEPAGDLHRITKHVLAMACDRLQKDPDLNAAVPVAFTRILRGKPVTVYR